MYNLYRPSNKLTDRNLKHEVYLVLCAYRTPSCIREVTSLGGFSE